MHWYKLDAFLNTILYCSLILKFLHTVPPTVSEPMESITEGIEDHEVTIECKADGKPSPEYEFYRLVVSI